MTKPIEKEIIIKAPPEAVWKAITDAEQINRWFAPEARVQPGQGGSIWVSWGPGFEGEARIEIWDEGRHLRTTDSKKPIAVDYHLEGRGGSTRLRLVQSFGEGDWADEYDSTSVGWTIFLGNLKAYLENRAQSSCRQAIIMLPLEGEPAALWPRALQAIGVGSGPDGSRFSGQTGGGEPMKGTVAWSHAPTAVVAEIDNLDARLYMTLEKSGGKPYLFFCLMAYAAPTSRVDVAALQARWTPMLTAALA